MARAAHEILIETLGRDRDAANVIDRIAAHLKALPEDEEIRIETDTVQATRNVRDLKRRVEELTDEVINLDIDKIEAERQVKEIERELIALGRTRDIHIGAEVSEAQRALLALRAQMIELEREKVEVKVDVDRSVFDRLRTVIPTLTSITRGASSMGSAFKATSDALDRVSVNLGPFTARGGVVLQLFSVLAPLVVAFGVVLAGLAGSLATAAAGMAALAATAAAVAAPIALIGIGAVAAFKSMTVATEEGERATEALADARERYADAERNVRRAQQDQVRAEKELADARREAGRDAREELTDAIAGVESAEYTLADAQRQSMYAQQALTQAREDARRALEDMRLSQEAAEIGERRANMNLRDARSELERLENDPFATQAEIREARLRVREAELAKEEATLRSQRATEDLNEAEAKGVEGSDQVVSAKQQIVDADRAVVEAHAALAEAQRTLSEAERANVRQAPAVVAARRAVQAANQRVADSERALADAKRDTVTAQKEADEAQAKADQASPAFDRLVKAIERVGDAFRRMLGPGVNRIFDGLADATRNLVGVMGRLRPAFAGLGGAIGDAFRAISREFASPEWAAFFQRLLATAQAAVPKVTRLLIGFLRVMRDVVDAGLPLFTAGLETLAGAFEKLSQSAGISSAVEEAVSHFSSWGKLIGQVGRLLVNFFKITNPLVKPLVDGMADLAGKAADWLASSEGIDDVGTFFKDMEPLVGSVVNFFGKLIEAVGKFAQVMAPVLAPIIDGFTILLEPVTWFLDALLKFPPVVRSLIGVFGGAFRILGKFKSITGLVRTVLSGAASIILSLVRRVGDLAGGIKDHLIGAFKTLGNIGGKAWDTLKGAAVDAFEFFKSLPGRLFNIAKNIVSRVIAGLGRAGESIPGWFKDAFLAVIRFLGSLPGKFFNLAKKILSKLIKGLKTFAGEVPGWFRDQIGKALDFLGSLPGKMLELGKKVMQGLIDGIKWAKDKVEDAMRWVLPGPIEDFILGGEDVDLNLGNTGAAGKGIAGAIEDAVTGQGKGKKDKRRRRAAAGPNFGSLSEGGGGAGLSMTNYFTVPGDERAPDPRAAAAALSRRLRAEGVRLST